VQVRVAGHQVETSETLQARVSERIEAIADKYFDRAIAANVTFGRGPYDDFTCEIVAPVPQGVVLKASGRAGEARIAFEGAADKIERQLSRYMKRLRERRSNGHGEMCPALARTLLRWACSATGRKPRNAATAMMPMAPTAAEGEPSAWASGTTATAVTVAPVVMVTV